MKKKLKKFAQLAMASACGMLICLAALATNAMATVMWGISDHRNNHVGAEIFSWDVSDGTFLTTPYEIQPIARARGLAVAGNLAFVSYLAEDRDNDPDSAVGGPSSHRMMMFDVTTNTILGDVATPRLYTGLTWDGTSLYAGAPYDNAIYRLGVSGLGINATYTGADTLVATIADNHQGNPGNYNPGNLNWAGNIPGLDPVTGKYYVNFEHIEYSQNETLEQAGGQLTLYNRITGADTDLLGSMAFDSQGRLLSTKAVRAYDVLEQHLHFNPGIYTGAGAHAPATVLYNLETVNSYTFLGADQLYGMSPGGSPVIPEPGTLALVAMGGLMSFLVVRRRSRG